MRIKSLVCTGALGMLAAHSLMAEGLWGIRNYRELVEIDPATANVVQTVPIVGVSANWVKFTLAYHKGEGVFYGFAFQTFFEVKLIRYDPSTGQATDLGFLPGNRYFEGLEYVDSLNSLIASGGEFNAGSPRIGKLSPGRIFTELLNNGGDNDVLAYDSKRDLLYSLDTTGENFSQQGFVIKINLTNAPNAEVLDQEAAYHPRVDAFFAAKLGKLYRWQVAEGHSLEFNFVGDIPGQNTNNPHTPLAYVDDSLFACSPGCESSLVIHDFSDPAAGTAGWRGEAEGGSEIVEWRQENGDGYIHWGEDQGDSATMFFVAPPAFLGDQRHAYGGRLAFAIRQRNTAELYSPNVVVIIESGGLRLRSGVGRYPGTVWETFEVPLIEGAGWTNAGTATAATRTDLLQVLGALDRLAIRGEYSAREVERTGLDNVRLIAPLPRLNVALIAEQLELSWPSNCGCFHLEVANEITGNWNSLNAPETVQSGTVVVQVSLSSTKQFFRLARALSE